MVRCFKAVSGYRLFGGVSKFRRFSEEPREIEATDQADLDVTT